MKPFLAPTPDGPVERRRSLPTFSVVIAAYQVADLIGEGIASVLGQTRPPLEVIVADDGSSDGLEEVVRRFGDRVTYLPRAHAGAGAAMNAGALEASAEYLVFIGSDDLFAPRRLEALAELATARPDLHILTTDAYVAMGNEIFRRFYDETNPFVVEGQRAEILERNFIFGHTAVPRERFLELGGFDETIRWTSDWELWIRMILDGSRVGLVDEPLATYRLWERSLSSQRLNQSRGKIATLQRTLEHPCLSAEERERVERGVAACRREVAAGEAEAALIEGRADARRLAIAVARTSGFPLLTRAKALGATIAPPLAAALLRRERSRFWTGAGGVRVPRRVASDSASGSDDSRWPSAATVLHGIAGRPGSTLEALLDGEYRGSGDYLRPLIGPFASAVTSVSAPFELIEAAGDIPVGEAGAEALAVLLRRQGVALERGNPELLETPRQLERLCLARGRSSLAMIRSDPSLGSEMQVGSWYQVGWKGRLLRRLLLRAPRLASLLRILVRRPAALQLAADVWFWVGVRREASRREWRRLTRSSYVSICYHRLAGELKEEEIELDVPPRHFEHQLRLLRVLGYRPLSQADLLAFHADASAVLPRRRFVVTADDGYLDAILCLEQNARALPIAFIPTAFVSGEQTQRRGTPIAGWELLARACSSGVAVGSHGVHHVSFVGLEKEELADELAGSRAELERMLGEPIRIFAYPYGNHDEAVREATIAAGYEAAFATTAGRNGAGTDRWCLHRISIQARNSLPAFLWKVVTGEPLPERWERRDAAREARARRRNPPIA
ncbi:MAG: glycosyltransferase [Gaiellaceae bacterium]